MTIKETAHKWKIPRECKTCKWRKNLGSRAIQNKDWANTACHYTLETGKFRPESLRKYGEPMQSKCSCYTAREGKQ